MANARSHECHPKCATLPSVLFSATLFLVLFTCFSRLVMPFFPPPFFEISWFINMMFLFVLKSVGRMWDDFQHWSLGSPSSDLPSLQLMFPIQGTASLLPASPTSPSWCALCASPKSYSSFQVSKLLHCPSRCLGDVLALAMLLIPGQRVQPLPFLAKYREPGLFFCWRWSSLVSSPTWQLLQDETTGFPGLEHLNPLPQPWPLYPPDLLFSVLVGLETDIHWIPQDDLN